MTALAEVMPALRCPVCSSEMTQAARVVACQHGHSFDIARQGYLNLSNRAAPHHADTSAMVAARQRVLASGAFDGVVEALRERSGTAGLLIDVGSGPGWYASRLLDTAPDLHGLALDISVPAIKAAARASDRLAAVVADTWQPLPVSAQTAGTILCVFAPRNIVEFRRIVRSDGRVLIVTPRADHLTELRQALPMLGIGSDKLDALDHQLASTFTVVDRAAVVRQQMFDDQGLIDLIGMGPNAHHARVMDEVRGRGGNESTEQLAVLARRPVSIAVDVTVAVPR